MQPQGAAAHNLVIQLALSLVCSFLNIVAIYAPNILLSLPFSHFKQVASESVKIYRALSDGTVNLVDKVSCNFNFLNETLFFSVNHVRMML